MKKLLTALLLAALLLVNVAAFAEVTYPVEETATIKWWHPLRAPSYQSSHDDNICWQAIAENVGVEIEWIHPASGTETEQLNLLLVGGDLPHIIQIDGYLESAGGAAALVDDGVAVDLTDYLEEYAPDYLAGITASDLAYQMATTADGRVVQFTQLKQTSPQYNRVNVRDDIMKEIGWTDENGISGLRLPETIADYTEMFAAMKEAGYYGYRTNKAGRDTQIMTAFGIWNGWYVKEDGTIGYGMWDDKYRDYLKQVREWIVAGYVHPDWASDVSTSALFTNKEIGMYITPSDIAYGAAVAGGYDITCVNYPRMNSGDPYPFENTTWDVVPADGIRTVVTQAAIDDGVFEQVMALLNYGYTEEGALIYNWGIKDVTYTEDEEGNKTYTDLILNNDTIPASDGQYIYKLHFGPKLAEADVQCNPGTIGDPKALYWRELYSDDPTVSSDCIMFASLTAQQSLDRAEYMVDIETYMNESTLQFLLGDKDINDDAAWQEYMDTMQSLGIEEAIAITQEAQDAFAAKEIPTDWVQER
ncbi:MAG: hypothetical protein ACI4MF_03240 [Candidatus Faecivicinus sp.]